MQEDTTPGLLEAGIAAVGAFAAFIGGWLHIRHNSHERVHRADVAALHKRIDDERAAQSAARDAGETKIWDRLTSMADKAAEAHRDILSKLGHVATREDIQALTVRLDHMRDRHPPHAGE